MTLDAKVNLLLEIALEEQRRQQRIYHGSNRARRATDYARRLEVALS